MKNFKVLSSLDTKMQLTNQRVAVFELAEVEYEDFSLPYGLRPYTFETEGKRFVMDFNSFEAKRILQSAIEEELVEIDLSEFYSRFEDKNGRREKIFYHKNVKLLDK